jgi:protocatechuate 3,4-dioxygenase beta subunit
MMGLGQPPAPPEQPVDPKTECIVSGRIVHADTGEPIRKATVELYKHEDMRGPRQAESTEGGKFEIRGLTPGRYGINANRAGYANQSYGSRRAGRGAGTVLTLTAGQHMKDVVIKLTPHGVITGRILDEDGEPKMGAQVSAAQWQWISNKRQLVMMSMGSTNDLGEYRIFGIAPGNYYVQVSQSRDFQFRAFVEEQLTKPDEGYITTYYPGVTDSVAAIPVSVRAGAETRGIDIRFAKSKVFRIRGRVIDGTTGKPAMGAHLMLVPKGKGYAAWNEMRNTSAMDAKGRFEFRGIPPGAYMLTANSGNQDLAMQGTVPLEVGENHVVDLEIMVSPGGTLSGKLEEIGEKKDSESQPGPMRMPAIFLRPAAEEEAFMGGGYGQVKEDGTFTIKGVKPGRLLVETNGLPGGYVKRVLLGEEDVSETGLDFTAGVPASTLTIEVSYNAAEVTGTVKSAEGKAIAGAMVALFPKKKTPLGPNFPPTAVTDQYGSFRVPNVRPGEYGAVAFEELEHAELQDPEFAKLFEDKTQKLELKENSKEPLDLKAISPKEIAAAREKRGM